MFPSRFLKSRPNDPAGEFWEETPIGRMRRSGRVAGNARSLMLLARSSVPPPLCHSELCCE
jgi:hypothetical protein